MTDVLQTTPDRHVDPALLPSEAEVAAFRETGWWLSPPLFSEAELDAAIELQDRYYAGERHPGPDVAARSGSTTSKPRPRRPITSGRLSNTTG